MAKYLGDIQRDLRGLLVVSEDDALQLAVVGYHIGPTRIREAVRKTDEKFKELTLRNVLENIEPESVKADAIAYIKKIGAMMKAQRDGR